MTACALRSSREVRGAHFRRNNACKVIFYRNNVDGGHCFAANQFEIAFETLVFFAFPVEIHADYSVFELEDAFERCGFKYYFCIFVAVPHHGAVGATVAVCCPSTRLSCKRNCPKRVKRSSFVSIMPTAGRTVLFENLFDIGCNIVYFGFGQT